MKAKGRWQKKEQDKYHGTVAFESDLERKQGHLCGIDFEIFIIRATRRHKIMIYL